MLLFTRNHEEFSLESIDKLLSGRYETELRGGHVGLLFARSESVKSQISVDEGLEEITVLFRDFESQPRDFQDFLNSAERPQLIHLKANGESSAVEEFLQIFFDAGLGDYYCGKDGRVHAQGNFKVDRGQPEESSGTVDHSTGPAFVLKSTKTSSQKTKLGGIPTNVATFKWPQCAHCQENQLFLGQINLAETQIESLAGRRQTLLLFQCANNPGMCDDWDPDAGGNAAVLVRDGKKSIKPPKLGETTSDQEIFVQLVAYDASVCIETDDDNYVTIFESEEGIVGKTGGNPVWIQDDETPSCECGQIMRFVAIIEECSVSNFGGGGAGYAFVCEACKSSAKFLWQQ